jgi:tripartite-type tricarboxylate transporter receptor subunit TctC
MLTCLLLLGANTAVAQGYPVKTIRVVAPVAAGGTGDMLARFVADRLTDAFKQQAVVENRAGANGIIGTEIVAKAAPDGYTLVVASAGNIAINPGLYGARLPFDPERDLAPVTQVANTTQILIVHPSVPAKTVKELISLAKASPGKLDYVNAGNGSTPHLNMALFASMAGIKLNGIVYKGSTPGRVAVVAGETPLMVDGLMPSMPLIQSARENAQRYREPLERRHRGCAEATGRHRTFCQAGRRCGCQYSRRVWRLHQARNRQVGKGDKRGGREGRLTAVRPGSLSY